MTGTLPSGVIFRPLTVLGLMWDGKMLSTWCPMALRTSCPAAQMSAPESGSTSMKCWPVGGNMPTLTVGAGSVIPSCIVYSCRYC